MHERWLILAVLTIARTDMGFQFQSVAAASQHLIGRFDLSFAALGILIGLYLFPGVAVAIPGGLLAQRFAINEAPINVRFVPSADMTARSS